MDQSPTLESWVNGQYWAGWENCRTLSRLRMEDPAQCDDPKIPLTEPHQGPAVTPQ